MSGAQMWTEEQEAPVKYVVENDPDYILALAAECLRDRHTHDRMSAEAYLYKREAVADAREKMDKSYQAFKDALARMNFVRAALAAAGVK